MKTVDEAANEFAKEIRENSLSGSNAGKQQYQSGRKIGFKAGVKFTQRWISVEEELPSEENELLNVPVICITGFGNYRISEYNGNEWSSDEIVTFWRPI